MSTGRRRATYWWNDEIRCARELALSLQRQATRARARKSEEEAERTTEEYRGARRLLKKLIRKSKKECWAKLVNEIELDTHGMGFKIVTKKIAAKSPVGLSEEVARREIDKLFPTRPNRPTRTQDGDEHTIDPFLQEEIIEAAKMIVVKKAPGPDKIPAEITKLLILNYPEYFTTLYNQLLKNKTFPEEWKRASVVLLEKKKDGVSVGYRPICLIDVAAKVYERLLANRIKNWLDEEDVLAHNQYGFRKGKSTIDALMRVKDRLDEINKKSYKNRRLGLLITLDIRNAFNTAEWSAIIKKLETIKLNPTLLAVIDSYLRDRNITHGGIKNN